MRPGMISVGLRTAKIKGLPRLTIATGPLSQTQEFLMSQRLIEHTIAFLNAHVDG